MCFYLHLVLHIRVALVVVLEVWASIEIGLAMVSAMRTGIRNWDLLSLRVSAFLKVLYTYHVVLARTIASSDQSSWSLERRVW